MTKQKQQVFLELWKHSDQYKKILKHWRCFLGDSRTSRGIANNKVSRTAFRCDQLGAPKIELKNLQNPTFMMFYGFIVQIWI